MQRDETYVTSTTLSMNEYENGVAQPVTEVCWRRRLRPPRDLLGGADVLLGAGALGLALAEGLVLPRLGAGLEVDGSVGHGLAALDGGESVRTLNVGGGVALDEDGGGGGARESEESSEEHGLVSVKEHDNDGQLTDRGSLLWVIEVAWWCFERCCW